METIQTVIKLLEVNDIIDIAAKVQQRQHTFNEPIHTSLCVVLLNHGEELVDVTCSGPHGWTGKKKDLIITGDIPRCPEGHVLFETTRAPRLALVQEGNTNA